MWKRFFESWRKSPNNTAPQGGSKHFPISHCSCMSWHSRAFRTLEREPECQGLWIFQLTERLRDDWKLCHLRVLSRSLGRQNYYISIHLVWHLLPVGRTPLKKALCSKKKMYGRSQGKKCTERQICLSTFFHVESRGQKLLWVLQRSCWDCAPMTKTREKQFLVTRKNATGKRLHQCSHCTMSDNGVGASGRSRPVMINDSCSHAFQCLFLLLEKFN